MHGKKTMWFSYLPFIKYLERTSNPNIQSGWAAFSSMIHHCLIFAAKMGSKFKQFIFVAHLQSSRQVLLPTSNSKELRHEFNWPPLNLWWNLHVVQLKLWLLLIELPKGLLRDYLANRSVHSAAISSCLALSDKYKRAILEMRGLSVITRTPISWAW